MADCRIDYDIAIVAREIAKALAGKGMTQYQLAEVIGISQNSLCGKLKGKSWFTVREVYIICKELGLSPLIFFPHLVPNSEQIA